MADDRLFSVQRQEHLLNELRRHGSVRVRKLAAELGVSELTVRRDIAALAERNLVAKVHGGATLPHHARPALVPNRKQQQFTIGMVVPSLDFYWPQIVAGARAAAAALGVSIQLRGSSYDPQEDRRQISRLVEAQQVHGLLLAPNLDYETGGGYETGDYETGGGYESDGAYETGGDDLVDWIGHLPVPTILVERQPQRWTDTPRQIECVRSDHALGLEIAVHHLAAQGHRRLGLLLSRGSPTSAYLLRGWQAACADVGIVDSLVVRESVGLGTPGHRQIIRDVLAECRRSKITGLIVHSDPDAISVAQFCAEQGVAIPDDLALVSYDDEVAHLAEPALTAVRPAKTHVGRLAVEVMVSRLLDGERRPSQRVLVAPELIVRGSSLSRRPVAVRS